MMFWRRPLLLVGLVIACGCMNPQAPTDEIVVQPISPDEPVCFRINTKGEVQLNKRWVNVFNEQGRVRDYLRRLAELHRGHYESEGTTLPVVRRAGLEITVLPTPVVLEPEAKTKAGTVLAMRRLCAEAGFVNLRVTVREEQNASGQ